MGENTQNSTGVNIRISRQTRTLLKNIGKKGETYNDIILKLYDAHKPL